MPKPTDYDKTHLRNLAAIGTRIDRIFKKAAEEAARIGVSIKTPLPDDAIFSFDDYPETKKQIERLMAALRTSMETTIVNGVESAWTLSNNKNNALVARIFGDNAKNLPKEEYRRYFSTNGVALDAFKQRQVQGLNLSDRVWKYTDLFKKEIELALDLGIRTGESAQQMTKSLKQYLQHPDKLFRRVRDKHGNLRLSKAAQAFHPGRGVYRSSYKNARRLAATETNIAYRTSDYLRWQQMDFVVGIEIKLSNNHTLNGVHFTDICDTLKGRYPKDFKFVGWHPHCRCHAVSILKTEDEMAEDTRRILAGEKPKKGSVNAVEDVPATFKDWVEEHADRIEMGGNLPYFIKDNRKRVDRILGIAEPEPKKTPLQIAKERHDARTPEDAAKIQQAWNERRIANLRQSVADGLLPKEAIEGLSALPQEELNARLEFLQKQAKRHASRSQQDIEDIKKAWAEKQLRDKNIRIMADKVLDLRKEYPFDVDFSALERFIAEGNLTKMQEETKKVGQAILSVRADEKALADLIPDARGWHKMFDLSELKEAHAKIQSTLDYWKAKGYDLATDSNLATLKKELEQKIKFVENPGAFKYGLTPHKTWQVQQDSYFKILDKVETRIETLKLEADYQALLGFKTTSKDFNDWMAKAKAALDAGDIATAKTNLSLAEWKKTSLEAKRKKKGSTKGQQPVTANFDSSCFTAARKKNAYNALSEWQADKDMLQDAIDAYAQATREMKEAAESYTRASGSITKMLRAMDGFYEDSLSYAIKSAKEIDNLTDLIGLNLFKQDTWLYRDERAAFLTLKTGGLDVSKLDKYTAALEQRLKDKHGVSVLSGKLLKEFEKKRDAYTRMLEKMLVGRTGADPSFLSCGSHQNHHFSGTGGDNKYGIPKVRLEIYCPKGTQGLYAAPFNHYNSKRTGSDGFWNGKDAPSSIHEAEVFLQRGTKFRVLEARYDRHDDRWYVKVEIIGQEVRKTDGYESIYGKISYGYKTKFK